VSKEGPRLPEIEVDPGVSLPPMARLAADSAAMLGCDEPELEGWAAASWAAGQASIDAASTVEARRRLAVWRRSLGATRRRRRERSSGRSKISGSVRSRGGAVIDGKPFLSLGLWG
jgi:hypothetical protein